MACMQQLLELHVLRCPLGCGDARVGRDVQPDDWVISRGKDPHNPGYPLASRPLSSAGHIMFPKAPWQSAHCSVSQIMTDAKEVKSAPQHLPIVMKHLATQRSREAVGCVKGALQSTWREIDRGR